MTKLTNDTTILGMPVEKPLTPAEQAAEFKAELVNELGVPEEAAQRFADHLEREAAIAGENLLPHARLAFALAVLTA